MAWPSPESLGPFQATQRYALVDAGALGAHDLPPDNRVSGLVALENCRSWDDLMHTLMGVFARFGGTADQDFRESLHEWARHSPVTAQGALLPPLKDLRWRHCTRRERRSGWPS